MTSLEIRNRPSYRGNWTTGRLVSSWTGHVIGWTARGLVELWSSQLTNWWTRRWCCHQQ